MHLQDPSQLNFSKKAYYAEEAYKKWLATEGTSRLKVFLETIEEVGDSKLGDSEDFRLLVEASKEYLHEVKLLFLTEEGAPTSGRKGKKFSESCKEKATGGGESIVIELTKELPTKFFGSKQQIKKTLIFLVNGNLWKLDGTAEYSPLAKCFLIFGIVNEIAPYTYYANEFGKKILAIVLQEYKSVDPNPPEVKERELNNRFVRRFVGLIVLTEVTLGVIKFFSGEPYMLHFIISMGALALFNFCTDKSIVEWTLEFIGIIRMRLKRAA
ncbi:hypothetical protein GF360_00990 [candidate division WWE3 bacterium]|nr:hypothetical protein [candidate division WWE3 bacterium]